MLKSFKKGDAGPGPKGFFQNSPPSLRSGRVGFLKSFFPSSSRFRFCFLFVALALAVGMAVLHAVPSALPHVTNWPVSPALFDRRGNLFHVRLSSAEEYCIPMPLYRMGKWLPRLAVAVEDKRFHSHPGLDPLALCRAMAQNLSQGHTVSGASTITSQLVRIAIPRPRTLGTKLLEFAQAIKLEWELDKNAILELYLNRAPMGGVYRGVEAAARGYFGKRAEDLSLAESAALVAMFQGPTYYRPDRNPTGLLERRNRILRQAGEDGWVSGEELRLALREPAPRFQAALPLSHWHFAEQSLDRAAENHWEHGGAPLNTSLDPQVQDLLSRSLALSLAGMPADVTAAGAVVDNNSGALLAYVGNARFDPSSGLNWVDCGDSPRSPGSTLKPFIYLEALEQGLLVPGSLLADTPRSFSGQAPRNFDRSYRGPVSATQALSESLNAPAVRVLRLIGGEAALHRIRALGFRHFTKPAAHYGDSLVLGGCEVTLLELAQAYSDLAGMGTRHSLVLNSDREKSETKTVFSAPAAYLTTEMLHAMRLLPPEQREALAQKRRGLAFKTGTSYGLRDAWVCAYTPEHTVVIWLGNEQGKPHEELVGAAGAAPAAFRILRDIPLSQPAHWYSPPVGVESFVACRLSGRPATPFCPETASAQRIQGISQTLRCTLHRETSAGVRTTLPPDLEEFARLRSLESGDSPAVTITSPRPGSSYYLNTAAPEQKLALRCEGQKGRVYWFVNRALYAVQDPDTPLLWPMRPGRFTISLVDERGKSAAVSFQIIDTAASRPVPLRLE